MSIPLDEITISDLIAYAGSQSHPIDGPSAENANLIDSRLSGLYVWKLKIVEVVNPYLLEDDGSDLIPDHVRVPIYWND